MVLDKISIINYKNIQHVETQFSPKINCLIGHNGEGKTNLLDAIYYLSFCRSSNNPIDSKLIKHNEDFLMIDGYYSHDNASDVQISVSLKRGRKKIFKRNGKAYKRLSEHIGYIPLVLVTPKDSMLVDNGGDERRNFMNLVISQYDHAYIEALTNYNKAMQQRNSLLKTEGTIDLDLMEILENEMARNGEKIYEKRKIFIEEFISFFQRIYSYISGGKESVDINYVSHCQRGRLIDVIQRDRNKDIAVGFSLHGIHRDNLELMLDGYSMRYEGSQGQNKTLVLSMKLAQFEFLKRTITQTTPLLLLDDIFDKLDAERVEKIVSLVSGDDYGQIFITDTNRDHLDRILANSKNGYSLFMVENGTINKI
jgi:DNA replication and repair protein RecF